MDERCRGAPNGVDLSPPNGSSSKDVYFYGTPVTPAELSEPDSDVFLVNKLLFSKPRWVPDEDACICYNCAAKFTAVRRKHHCRQCGRVFCSQCSSNKMQLSHLSYQTSERICVLCRGFVSLIVKAQSHDLLQKLESLSGFEEICKNTRTIIPFIEMGGVIALLFVAREKDCRITNTFLRIVKSLALHASLKYYLASVGTIRLLTRKFLDADRGQHVLLCDIIDTLKLLCSSDSVKSLALQEGTIDALIPYCNPNMGPVCLPALDCLCIVCSHPCVYTAIVDGSQSQTLAKLLILTTSEDEKVKNMTLRILAQISSGSEWHRRRIVEEDIYNGSLLAEALTVRSTSLHILINATCLIANLAVDEVSQGALANHLMQMCRLLDGLSGETEVLRHVARGLANFAKFRNNCEILLQSLELIVVKLMQSTEIEIQHHGCQIIVALLRFCTSSCAEVLARSGTTYFLEYLGYNNEVMDALSGILGHKLPMIVVPEPI